MSNGPKNWTILVHPIWVDFAMKRPFYLKLRGNFWYFRLNKESGLVEEDEQRRRATGCTDRGAAEQYVVNLTYAGHQKNLPAKLKTFRQYSMPFFLWGECPHVRRIFEETGRFTERHSRIQRGRLVSGMKQARCCTRDGASRAFPQQYCSRPSNTSGRGGQDENYHDSLFVNHSYFAMRRRRRHS